MVQIKSIPKTRWKEHKELRLEALKKYPKAFGTSLKEELKFKEKDWNNRTWTKNSDTVFALDNNKLVGMVAYFVVDRLSQRHIANVVGMYVKEEYQNQGVGKKLLEAIFKKIKERGGVTKIKITVVTTNKPALKLYEKVGFKKTALLKKELKINGKYYDEYLMEMLL